MNQSSDLTLLPPPAAPGVPSAPLPPAAENAPPSGRGGGDDDDDDDDDGWSGYLLRLLAILAGLAVVVYGYQVLLGGTDPTEGWRERFVFQVPVRYSSYGFIFLTASALLAARRRELAMAVVAVTCLHHIFLTDSRLALYAVILVPALDWLLGREERPGCAASVRFWAGMAVGVVIFPKWWQAGVEHHAHGSWLDANQNFFAGFFLRYAYYFYERRRGLVPPGRFQERVSYLLFVPQVTGMLTLPPSEMSARWGFSWETLRRGWTGVGWAALKIPVVLWLEWRVVPAWGYGRGYGVLRALPVASLWACLLVSYLHWAVLISLKFDLMCALFRFFGVNVDDNFRWPLLATSPVDLWRRWNIYNRRLLLKLVYFPLGGKERHVYRNILCTFLASALLLHTGYLGSPWWTADVFQTRDWLLYFAGQGALVCAAYWWLNRPFWTRPAVARWRWPLRAAGWAFTLAASAWLHVLPLAAGNLLGVTGKPLWDLGERLTLMRHALGLP